MCAINCSSALRFSMSTGGHPVLIRTLYSENQQLFARSPFGNLRFAKFSRSGAYK